MTSSSSNKAWITLATNDSYSLGALVLAHSLKAVKTVHKLAILITPGVTSSMKQKIEAVFDEVKVVDVLDSKDQTHLALMSRPELGITFTKLHCWTFTNYEKCVFLDADTLVLQNCDELFDREEFSAAPDPGWPDCFNSGVFVYKPSQDTFGQLLEFARTRGSFDGGDQGLLNMFFKDWSHTDISKHLSFTYNVVWSSTYSYLPALKEFGQNMKIIHFIASSKPWLQSFNTETRLVTATSGGSGLQTLLQLWWDLFCRHVHPELSTDMIESRLSSRYSYDFNPKVILNNNQINSYIPNYRPNNNNSNNYYTPSYEPPIVDHYTFDDPWEEYLASNKQTHYETGNENEYKCHVHIVRDCCNIVEEFPNNHCEPKEIENNYYKNTCDTEKPKSDYTFLNNIIEISNTLENVEESERFESIKEFDRPMQEQIPITFDENCPACFDDVPINLNSDLSVNNYRPDSPPHCEVPMDQTCDLNGGLAGQFARVPLGEKTTDQRAVEDFLRRQSWEQGNMDYLGKDSFSNIWAKINETLGGTPEVKIESDVVKAPSPPEVVHTEEPKPLKSALKKTSTTVPPVESELVDSSEPPVKQLEKLDLSKDDSSQVITPNTPTVTSPTPPTTPATQAQEPAKPEAVESVKTVQPSAQAVEPVKTTPTPAQAVDSVKTAPTPTPAVEPVKTTPTPVQAVEPVKQISKPVEAVESVKTAPTPAPAVEPVKTTPTPVQAVEPVKQISKPAEAVEPVKTAQTPAQAVEPLKETPKPAKVVESPKETPKLAEAVEPLKETPKPADPESTESVKIMEPVKETPAPDKSTKESSSSGKEEQSLPKLEESVKQVTKPTKTPDKSTKESLSSGKEEQKLPKLDEPVKQVTKPTETAQKSQSSTEASGSLESDGPPVAPKRTNKGSPNVPKK